MTSLGTPPGSDPDAAPRVRRGARSTRVLLPAGVAAVAAVGVGLVPALAASGSPQLPKLTAQQLIARMLGGQQQKLDGTVQVSADLGVPSQVLGALPTSAASAAGAAGAAGGQGAADPRALAESLLSGTHTFQVAADGPLKLRVSSADLAGGSYTFVRNGSSAWAYQGSSRTATHITGLRTAEQGRPAVTTPQAAAEQIVRQLGPTTDVAVQGATRVAGRNAYVLLLTPKSSGSTIGDVRIALDSATYVPLQVQVQPSDGSADIADVRFTTVSFSAPAASTFDFTVPNGSRVVTRSGQQAHPQAGPQAGPQDRPGRPGRLGRPGLPAGGKAQGKVIGQGWTSVYELTPSGVKGGALGQLKSFGKSVPGGTLFSTRVVNVLVTDKGTVYAGLVTPQVLEQDAR